MKTFVFLSGLLNGLLGILFTMPGLIRLTGIEPPDPPFWLMFPAVFLFFLGIILMVCSRDLENRATLVFWDGMSRVAAFAACLWFGLYAGMGIPIVLAALGDLAVALVYFIGLPRALDRTFMSILLDRRG
ncbi:MAG TPA: hypothetical protein P5238_11585 [Smithellaceae bacterium]|nr:hypothetical protein [Smithellaceae bacterium]HRS84116.1 hypothetical protein [Smithellaceae bacterium]HRV43920.1 hypothetical protein [Smithellaceae bacterium]